MGRVLVELVPRSEDGLRADLAKLKENIAGVDAINVPHLLRYDLSGADGAAIAQEYYPSAIAHVRAMDIDMTKPLPMVETLRRGGVKEVLVIEGDPPQSMFHTVYPTEAIDVIQKFKREMPEVKVYAGIEQYRVGMREAIHKVRRKVQAGADGFFTQPFFDMRFLEIYADLLQGLDVYWGISPVISPQSKSYWELKDSVVFPSEFQPNMAWSIEFGRKVYDYAKQHNTNVYIMPITADFVSYVSGIIG